MQGFFSLLLSFPVWLIVRKSPYIYWIYRICYSYGTIQKIQLKDMITPAGFSAPNQNDCGLLVGPTEVYSPGFILFSLSLCICPESFLFECHLTNKCAVLVSTVFKLENALRFYLQAWQQLLWQLREKNIMGVKNDIGYFADMLLWCEILCGYQRFSIYCKLV